MNLTLHLTNKCNLACKYCFVAPGVQSMSREVAFAAVKLGMEGSNSTGLLFYGGEPLIEKQLICDIVEHTRKIKEETGHSFQYKVTTNGTLLDEEFLEFSRDADISIGFSHDGPAQDDCRCFHNGKGSFDVLAEKIPLLLQYQPYAVAMSVVDPSTVHKAAEIVEFLYEKGFRYVTLNLNYDKTAPWTREHLAVLEEEYRKMAKLYVERTKAEEKFYLSPFDMKILSHLKGSGGRYNEDRRRMNREQPSVAPDGTIFSRSRYVDNPAYAIGNVFTGIDPAKRDLVEEKGAIPLATCLECALLTRCNYAYDSLDREAADPSQFLPDISPVQCTHEQLLTPIADHTAKTLYRSRSAMFMHKHYNELYPVLSLVEDNG